MRSTLLTFTVMILLSSLSATAGDKSPRTISDLPPKAQAIIQTALARNRSRMPEREGIPAPTDGPWAQLTQPVATADQAGGFFGISVAISGNIVVVGQPYNFSGNFIGEALVFVMRAHGDWNHLTQAAVLTPSDGLDTDLFASSVAISGNTIVVGSPPNQCQPCGPGRAYVYVRPSGGWSGQLTQTAELTASDGTNASFLGSSVSISGDTVVAGAPGETPGAAYVFVKPANGWVSMTQTAKLTASDGVAGNQFGASVSISGANVVAGAPYAPGITAQPGAAYEFTEPANGWIDMTQTAKLVASDGSPFDALGQSVSICGNTIVAGAPYAAGRNARSGAAYLFAQPEGGWNNATQTAKLIAPDGQQYDAFGSAVAIAKSGVVVGAPERSPGPVNFGFPAWWREGGAYVFAKTGPSWAQTSVQVLNGSDAHNDDLLGSSVGIDGDFVVTGAPILGRYAGAAFVFVRP